MNEVNILWLAREKYKNWIPMWIQQKTFDDIEPHKTHFILLQTSLDPLMLYSSNANALSWEENISMSFISENSQCCNVPQQHVQNHNIYIQS